MIGDVAKSMDCFEQISMSHEVMPMIKLVPRGQPNYQTSSKTKRGSTLKPNVTVNSQR
jgi:hypothetical protein